MGSRLEHVIARNVAELRTERGVTQADVALEMREYGFTWQSNRVAQIETLYRTVSLIDVIGLAWVFHVPVSRLFGGDDNEDITLPNGRLIKLWFLRESLTDANADPKPMRYFVDVHTAVAEGVKMSTKLGLHSALDLDTLAQRVFGKSFQAEREARLGDVTGLSKRSAQTKRGHVSRALLAELDDYLGKGEDRANKLAEIHDAEDTDPRRS